LIALALGLPLEKMRLIQPATGGAFDPTVLWSLVRAGYDRSFEQLAGSPLSVCLSRRT